MAQITLVSGRFTLIQSTLSSKVFIRMCVFFTH